MKLLTEARARELAEQIAKECVAGKIGCVSFNVARVTNILAAALVPQGEHTCTTCPKCGWYTCEHVEPSAPQLPCVDCGYPKDTPAMHLDASGTNWGAALHWYRAPQGEPQSSAGGFTDGPQAPASESSVPVSTADKSVEYPAEQLREHLRWALPLIPDPSWLKQEDRFNFAEKKAAAQAAAKGKP